MVTSAKFHWADYLVFCLNLLVSAFIGLYHGFGGKKKQDTKEFLVGGRNMSPLPVALSILASFLSAPFLMGIPVEIYLFGTMYSYAFLGQLICVITSNYLFLPVYHKLELTSAYEYLEKRFNSKVRVIGSLVFCIKMILFMAVIIYAPSVAFAEVTGLQAWVTILVTGLVCTFYTAVGGMKAVIWADVVQMIIIMICSLVLVILGCNAAGGYVNVLHIAKENGRLILDDFSPDPTVRHTFWTQTIGIIFGINAVLASNQVTIQRCMSIEKLSDVKKAMWYCLIAVAFCNVMITTLGLVIYAIYKDCDPITSGAISNKDQLVPMFVMNMLGNLKGLPGLFAAAVFSATLSTVSSGLNALAAVILIDMIKPAYYSRNQKQLDEQLATKISKGLATVLGLVTIGLAYLAPYLGPTILYLSLSLFGVVGGPLLGLFSLAIFFPTCNSKGAVSGLIVSLIFSIWIAVGGILYPNRIPPLPLRTDGCPVTPPMNSSMFSNPLLNAENSYFSTSSPFMNIGFEPTVATMPPVSEYQGLAIYKVSYAWLALIAWLTAVIVGLLVSQFTGKNNDREIAPELLYPYGEKAKSLKRMWQQWRGKEVDDDDIKKVSTKPEEVHLLHEMGEMTPVMPIKIGYRSESNGVMIGHIKDISTYQLRDGFPNEPENSPDPVSAMHRLRENESQSTDSDYDNLARGVRQKPYEYLQSSVRQRPPISEYSNSYIMPPPPTEQQLQTQYIPLSAKQQPQQPPPPESLDQKNQIEELKEKSGTMERKLEHLQQLLESQQELLTRSRFNQSTGAKRVDPSDPNWLNEFSV